MLPRGGGCTRREYAFSHLAVAKTTSAVYQKRQ
jgi:hypothetical protein